MPKVSVILTSYNHDNYIREAIDSVLQQSFSDFELLIWDDASVDNSWTIIQSYQDSRIRAFRNPSNQGPVFGINKAIFAEARGDYIAMHHSDDVWELDKLAKQVAFLDANQQFGAVFSNALPIDQRGVPLNDESHFYFNVFSQPNRSRYEWLRYFFLTGNALCHPSLLIRKQCYVDCGGYRDMLAQFPDFDMWMRLCAKYDIHIMTERLLKFRILDGEMNTSGNRPTTQTRCVNEHYQLFQHYRTLLNNDNVFKIFPEFIDLDRGDNTDADYVLAKICLADGFFLRQLLAIDILFDILNHPERRQAVEAAYGFSIQDFIHLTGQCDTFSRQQLQSTARELNEQIVERDAQMTELYEQIATLQQWQHELSDEIANLRLSSSWRLTKPLRDVSLWLQQIKHSYRHYRQQRGGVQGLKRLLSEWLETTKKKIADKKNKKPLAQLSDCLQKCSCILFDHNGGGGSNAYSLSLVNAILADGGNVLRVYYFDGSWFVQPSFDTLLYYTASIDELFTLLNLADSSNIIINSLYGYPDINAAVDQIIALGEARNASLDVKVHDFYALCSSPHLSDLGDQYCDVPTDHSICKHCLKKNLVWYHSWYPKENRPTDIDSWREPFAKLLAVASTVTFFDASSVAIIRKAFHLEDQKIRIVPHVIDYIQCDMPIDITGDLHIGVLGSMSHIKGGHVVNALCEYIDEQNLTIPVTVVGSSYMEAHEKLNIYGTYQSKDLPLIIRKHAINVILMPSIVPETFSYTISEAMAMNLPIVTFDIGAQGNRVKQYALGKVVPLGCSSAVILAAIQSVLTAAQE